MAGKPTFIVQSFEKRRGRIVPTAKDVAPSESGAMKKAEAIGSRLPGAAAIKVTVNEDGEVQSATILGTWGEIPEDFAESLQGG